MTRPLPRSVVCAVCCTESRHWLLASTNAFGPPDLDFRPPPSQRLTMEFWLEECPECGYCVGDLSLHTGIDREFLRSDPYRAQRQHPGYPDLANAFLCRSMIEEAVQALAEAARSSLHAAWVCDDHGHDGAATRCRRRALRLWVAGLNRGQRLSDEDGVDVAIAADLCRRVGDHHCVTRLLADNNDRAADDTVRTALRYQGLLAARGDTACHTIEDAFDHVR